MLVTSDGSETAVSNLVATEFEIFIQIQELAVKRALMVTLSSVSLETTRDLSTRWITSMLN